MNCNEIQSHAKNLMVGAYDLHIHPAPSHVRRLVDDVSLYHAAADCQMGGVLLKCHYEPTGARAQIINTHFKQGKTTAIGAIVLNWPVGGLNPYAVESACRLGAKYIWMPTRDAAHSLAFGNMIGDFFQRPGINILDGDEKLLPAVVDILDIAREKRLPVATGHISPHEAVILCQEGAKMGNKMVLTHPEWSRTTIPLEIQQSLVRQGVFIEKVWLNVVEEDTSEEYLFHTIRTLGPEHIFLGTDSGKAVTDHKKTPMPLPHECYQTMLSRLIAAGFSDAEIRTMSTVNPQHLIQTDI